MKIQHRIFSILLILAILLSTVPLYPVQAAYDETIQAPERLRVEALFNTPPDVQPAIGYNEYDGYYVDLKWNPAVFPSFSGYPEVRNPRGYYNIYAYEISKYGAPAKFMLREKDIPQSATSMRVRNLKPGTIYHFYVTAYYKYEINQTTYTGRESAASNTVKAMTDISLAAYSYGTHKIKIEWDDVFNADGTRAKYKLYVTDGDFANTVPISIGPEWIEPNGPVKVNTATGKLEYIHNVRDPGRVYRVKIIPDLESDEIKRTAETRVVSVSSFILAKTSKQATTEFGTIWRMDWTPVVTGLSVPNIKVSYMIYRGVKGSSVLPEYMASVEETSFFITVGPGDENNFYLIEAVVTRDGQPLYPVKIISDKIIMQETETPAVPASPELVNEFRNASGDVIISYDGAVNGALKPDSATLLWRLPKKGTGEVDTDLQYDIWLLTDPNLIDNPPESSRIARGISMQEANYVMDGSRLVGYKYALTGLTPNTTYYFKITASKTFVENIDDILQSSTYTSRPALKVIITPSEGSIEQPLIPSRPPLKIKSTSDNRPYITDNSAILQLKNRWYEKFNTATGRWEYIRTEKTAPNDVPPYDPIANPPDGKNYRLVAYDSGVTIQVGCVKFVEGMSYDQIAKLPTDKIQGVALVPNDPAEDPLLNPDGQKHNVDIPISGLEPNTQYIVWVRAARVQANAVSGPSDPVVITTKPVLDPTLEKPTIPVFNYKLAGDTYVDLGWETKKDYRYTIKYGEVDNLAQAKGTVTILPEDLLTGSFYRIEGLKPNTLYYFWIQAETVNSQGQKAQSEWSDSIGVQTLPPSPPETPRGFGLKNHPNAITKNTISYEWLAEDGLEYILEIGENIDYQGAKEYAAGKTAAFTASGLLSNHRYYARLYAYDPVKKLRSKPTLSITVRTGRSNDDYDADADLDTVPGGSVVDKSPTVINNTWNLSITGAQADRFIERIRTDNALDYLLDASRPPSQADRVVLTIARRALKALGDLKENLIIRTGDLQIIIQAGMLENDTDRQVTAVQKDFNYEISIQSLKGSNPKVPGMTLKTVAQDIQIHAVAAGMRTPTGTLAKPLQVEFPYDTPNWFTPGTTQGLYEEATGGTWTLVNADRRYNTLSGKGYAVFAVARPSKVAVAERSAGSFNDIDRHWAQDAIQDLTARYPLPVFAGNSFYPDKAVTIGEMVQMVYGFMGYSYEGDFMIQAYKAGFISREDMSRPSAECTREKAMYAFMGMYELKTGSKAESIQAYPNSFEDLSQITPAYYTRIKFAVDQGLVYGIRNNLLAPGETITRGEIMALAQRALALAGEID